MCHWKKFRCLALVLLWSGFVNIANAERSILEVAELNENPVTILANPATPLFNQFVTEALADGYSEVGALMDSQPLFTNAPVWSLVKTPVTEDSLFLSKLSDNVDAAHQSERQFDVTAASFTPLCPTLDIDTIYTLSGLQQGVENCYHFSIDKRSKSTAFVFERIL